MQLVHRLRQWFDRLFWRPPELLDFFSGLITILFTTIALIKYIQGVKNQGFDWLGESMDPGYWVGMGLALGLIQLVSLRFVDGGDPRHPIFRPITWLRCVIASALGAWYFTYFIALLISLGLWPTHAFYFGFCGVNGYIVAHVVSRR